MALIQIVRIANPFEPTRREIEEICYTGGKVTTYVETEGRDVYIDGDLVEHPDETTPLDGSQIVVIPHIAGKGIMRVLGLVAMIALSVYSSNIASGLWKGLGTAFRAGHIGALLASGAVMFMGGKIINAVFPQATDNINWNDHDTTQTYGWDLPTPTTTAGNVVGETYGECIPAAQLLEQHVETVNDVQYLDLLYCGGYGPVDSIDKIRIDYTDIDNFDGVQLETRLGTNDQKPISFFKNTPLDQEVGIELQAGQAVTRTSDSTKASALEVTIEFPAGLYHVNDKGNYDNATVKMLIEYRKGSTDSWHNFGSTSDYLYAVTGATNSALRKTFSKTGLDAGQYDVRITVRDKPSSSRYQTMVQWTMMTSYIDGIYSRPNKVLVALRIKASNQLSGGVPSLNWRQTRKTVLVHNPSTNQYEEKAADNPIWACYDILHGCRRLTNINTKTQEYVVSGYPASCLDAYYEQWKSAAEYADEEITNQDGEKEPRYKFDAFFDTAQKRWTAAQKAANVGHAVIIPHGRNIGIAVDRPGHITQIFGEGRTTVSSVKGSFSSTEDRAKAIEVTYNDGDNDFKNTVMTVRSPNYNTDNSSDNTAQLTLFGVKRRSQAYREAVTALATNERQLQFIELSADIDAIVAEYGDIVGFNHAVSRLGIASGRIVSASGSTVVLDKEVELEASKSYEIYISLSDDTLLHREIVASDGKTNTLTVSVPFDDAQLPQKFDNYAFGELKKAVKPFRIINASRDGDFKVSLKLAEYDEAMYSTELDYNKYPVIDYSSTPTISAIETLTAAEQDRTIDKVSVSDIVVSWKLARSGIAPDSYIVHIKSRNSSYDTTVSTRLTTYTAHDVPQGEDFDITVYCIFEGITVNSKETSIHINGISYSQNNATNLIVVLLGKGFNLSWTAATGPAVAAYNVYQGAYGAKLADCTKISDRQTGVSCYAPITNAGTYQFYVQSVDKDGNQFGDVLTGIGSITMPGKVTDASAYTLYRQYQDGQTGYDVVVNFTLPSKAKDVEVYYKTNHIDMTHMPDKIPEGVPADELGFYADWRYAGKGSNKVVISAAQLGDTYKLKLVAEDVNGFTTPDSDATYLSIKIEAKQTVPNTPTGFKKSFVLGKGFTFSWDDVTNSDVDYYELRYDQNCGSAANLIARAQGTSVTLESLPKRSATIYLYAHNATKLYSYPASLTYDYPVLNAPAGITITKAILSANVSVPELIDGAEGVRLYIEKQPIDIGRNTHYTYANDAGIYDVEACYYDVFGEGYHTAVYQAVIEPCIDPKYIEKESITLEKVDKTINNAVKDAQEAIPRLDSLDTSVSELKKTDDEIKLTVQSNKDSTDSAISKLSQKADSISSTVQDYKTSNDKVVSGLSSQVSQNASSIMSIVTNLGDQTKAQNAYSAIAQLIKAINLRVKQNDVINQINISTEGVLIDGKRVHVTGDTVFDNNVIVSKMLAAGAVTADKLSASLIALSNNQGFQGGSVTLDASGMSCTDKSGVTIKFGDDGMTSRDKNGNIFSALSQFMIGTAQNGKYVKFNNPWQSTPTVIVVPQNIQVNNPSYSTSKVRLHCYAEDVTVNGFRMRAYSGISEGAGSYAQYQDCGSAYWTIWRDNWAARNKGLPYGTKTISFTVKMPKNASRVCFHGRWKMNLSYKYSNFVSFPNAASQNLVIKCNGTQTYSGMFFSDGGNNEIHAATGVHGTDEYKSYVSNIFTVTGGYDLECTLTLSPWTEHDGDGSDGLTVDLLIDSLDVYVDGEQTLDDSGTGAFLVMNTANGLYTVTD